MCTRFELNAPVTMFQEHPQSFWFRKKNCTYIITRRWKDGETRLFSNLNKIQKVELTEIPSYRHFLYSWVLVLKFMILVYNPMNLGCVHILFEKLLFKQA